MSFNPYVVLSLVLGVVVYVQHRKRTRNPKGLPLPPGPRPHFLLGNLRDLPQGGKEWESYKKLSEKYGSDVIFLSVLGTPILSVNTFKAANDLLDKKGAVFSDRPRLPMIKELMGWDWNLVLMSYHEGFAVHRRIVQQKFQPAVVADLYRPIMLRETAVLLKSLLKSPEDFVAHLKRLAGATIMMVTYGQEVAEKDDEYVKLAEEVREHAVASPGAALVDTLPIMKHIPTWFPGAYFKREALARKALSVKMRNDPFSTVKKRISEGSVVPCMVSSLLEEKFAAGAGEDEEVIKNCGGVVYSAGADTTSTALTNFFLAMMTHPHVQERAQADLDEVVERGKLPGFEDKEKLPYVGRILKEVLRWHAVSPLGVPHFTSQDDEYNGRYIPKGTTVIPNIATMLNDPDVYNDPGTFDPDRFLERNGKPAEPDPARATFGFGRRICPGRFFAEDSLWIAMASILHVFHILPVKDSQGEVTVPHVEWSSGLVSTLSAFGCKIIPRYKEVDRIIAMSGVE